MVPLDVTVEAANEPVISIGFEGPAAIERKELSAAMRPLIGREATDEALRERLHALETIPDIGAIDFRVQPANGSRGRQVTMMFSGGKPKFVDRVNLKIDGKQMSLRNAQNRWRRLRAKGVPLHGYMGDRYHPFIQELDRQS